MTDMIRGGNGSHWDGCEETHWDCKIAKLEAEVERLRDALCLIRMVAGNKANPEADKAVIKGIVNDIIPPEVS